MANPMGICWIPFQHVVTLVAEDTYRGAAPPENFHGSFKPRPVISSLVELSSNTVYSTRFAPLYLLLQYTYRGVCKTMRPY